MSYRYRRALFIFRRDLRLEDNSALIAALRQSESVLTLFIADTQLLKPERHFANAFLVQSLVQLQKALAQRGGQLCLSTGTVKACLTEYLAREAVDAVFINRDYTPYAQQRDNMLKALCTRHGIAFHVHADQLLLEPEQGLKKDHTPYSVFTPFYRNAAQFAIARPQRCPSKGFGKAEQLRSLSVTAVFADAGMDQGTVSAEAILQDMAAFHTYEEERNFPALDKTTHLSVHLKFGTCSVRQVYHNIKTAHGSEHGLIRALYWRDFFTHIAWHFPHVFVLPFRQQYQKLQWSTSTEDFTVWTAGRTGFPIVDAGMRELNNSGFMHNRVRMIVASFLTKDLHIDWRRGEAYFREKLVDYDPCVNNGNWQWVASTGCDAQPWFRIFNPWAQQKKFDPDCNYIKHWLPELRALDPGQIHSPGRHALPGYPAPMLEHTAAVAITKQIYAAV